MRSQIRNGFNNPTSLPSWWTLVGAVGAVVFVLYAAIQAIPRDNDSSSGPTVPVTVGPIDTTPTTPTTPVPTGTVSVPGPDGTPLQVAVAAVDAGTAGVRALFTGNLAEVRTAPGSAFPAIGRTWPDPQVSAPAQAALVGVDWRLTFDVDPDGAGPEAARRLAVTVVEVAEGWAVRF